MLYLEHGNLNLTYKMGNADVSMARKEQALGVAQSLNVKMSEQSGIAALKANVIFGLISSNIVHKKNILL